MTRKSRSAAVLALGLGVALAAAGCAGNGDDKGGSSANGKVTLTLWENSTTGPGAQYWKDAVAAFHTAHPNVTIKLQAIQNEDFDGKLQTALNSSSAPDIFMQRGGGKMQAMVDAGQLQALDLDDATKTAAGAALAGNTIDGKVYAVPTDTQPEGIYYSQDLFKQAGITTPPTSMDELDTDVAKLKAAGITPIAVGAKDAWPAAHWYYNFALRECSQKTITEVTKSLKFTDECWTKAGEDVAALLKTDPFQNGFLTTAAQQGAGSSAGLVANHKAAMELMGNWDPGVIASLTPDQKPLPDLGWFPFPSVAGGKGDPSALMAGGGGYSLSKNAPKEALEFVEFILTPEQQKAYATAFQSIPVNKEAQSVVTQPYNISSLQAFNKAAYTVNFLDTQYGQNVGNALNTAVVNLLAGKGTAADIVKDTNAAAAKG
ncbi:ABC transporter substrate-binding protein [Gryllotalpicola koreensis]|uniref:Extracellular solute-binding protein n=1 Tax=Gryllotalpicola koreensis TaxID=993086 RepID=A0ABP7ZZV4_9MICO